MKTQRKRPRRTRPPGGANAPGADRNQAEMMQKMQAAGTPGAQHKALQNFVGSWRVAVKFWMDPNGPAQESHGTAKVTAIFGGRYFEELFNNRQKNMEITYTRQ